MGHVHLNGFSPVCSFMWLFRAHFSVKLLSHKWHANFLHEGERRPRQGAPQAPRPSARAPARTGRGRGQHRGPGLSCLYNQALILLSRPGTPAIYSLLCGWAQRV